MRFGFTSNGSIASLYDKNFYIRELYYPYLGQYNHAVGSFFKVGLWHNGNFVWLEDLQVDVKMRDLIVDAKFSWDGVDVTMSDVAIFSYPAIIRKVETKGDGLIRYIFYHDFKLNGNEIGDTAFYDPTLDAVIHYKGKTWFLMGSTSPIYEYTMGRRDKQEVLKDCEDGTLSKNSIAQGSVASAISIASPSFYYFIIAGENYDEVANVFKEMKENAKFNYEKNERYWKSITSSQEDELAKMSLAISLGHVGDKGEIPASLDTDILKFNLDTYAYIWPRDASLTANVLDMAGFTAFTRKFYDILFTKLFENGYLFQKYNPDGTWGSTWHPWTVRTKKSFNIQEDETGTAIWAFWNYFERSRDYDLLKKVYHVIRDAGNFMVSFRDEKTGLPLETFDLWEEKLGVHTYTAASVYAGLISASKFAEVVGDWENMSKWKDTANQIKEAMKKFLFDNERGVFFKYVNLDDGKITNVDKTVESSTLGIVTFQVFDINDPMVESTVKVVEEKLWVKNVGGLARYENDFYQKIGDYKDIPGNPWIITTMWLAQYYAKKNKDRAIQLLDWARKHAVSGLLPEQLNPFDGSPLSVTPLLWSHAEYLKTYIMLK
jgi:GH15 family glucan-1,4-alpha-glucosidase